MDGLPPLGIREAIARAAHRAVRDLTGTDGFRYCYLYSAAGWALAREVIRPDYLLQAGAFRVLADPDQGWLALHARDDGLGRGAFHCWFARSGPAGEPAEIVDLSSRHYRRWVDSSRALGRDATTPVRWAWPDDPPEFLWSAPPFPTWLGLAADRAMTLSYLHSLRQKGPELRPLHRLARQYYELEIRSSSPRMSGPRRGRRVSGSPSSGFQALRGRRDVMLDDRSGRSIPPQAKSRSFLGIRHESLEGTTPPSRRDV